MGRGRKVGGVVVVVGAARETVGLELQLFINLETT